MFNFVPFSPLVPRFPTRRERKPVKPVGRSWQENQYTARAPGRVTTTHGYFYTGTNGCLTDAEGHGCIMIPNWLGPSVSWMISKWDKAFGVTVKSVRNAPCRTVLSVPCRACVRHSVTRRVCVRSCRSRTVLWAVAFQTYILYYAFVIQQTFDKGNCPSSDSINHLKPKTPAKMHRAYKGLEEIGLYLCQTGFDNGKRTLSFVYVFQTF